MELGDSSCSTIQDFAIELNSKDLSSSSLKRLAPLAIFTKNLDKEDTSDLINQDTKMSHSH